MTMMAKVFKNGKSQVIRLPKECRVHSEEVYIEKVGHSLVIIPKEKSKWNIMRNAVEDFDGFKFEINQPVQQIRELF